MPISEKIWGNEMPFFFLRRTGQTEDFFIIFSPGESGKTGGTEVPFFRLWEVWQLLNVAQGLGSFGISLT